MIAVIADDLSGAAELANIAVQAGYSAEVQTRFFPASDAEIICVDTETRSLPPEAAAACVEEITRLIATARPTLVYKKCDSVLRGHVAFESLAIARALGRKRVVLIPANPSRQRIIRGGEYFVNGIPLAQTAFAADPEFPRLTSRVAELLGNATGLETPDTISAADVLRHAATVDAETLPVGGADFFSALLDKLPRAAASMKPFLRPGPSMGPSLFVCGSNAALQSGQAVECRRRGIPVLFMPNELFQPAAPDEVQTHWAVRATEALRKHNSALLIIGNDQPAPGVTPKTLADRLAQAVELTLQQISCNRVLLEGGATAAAVVNRLGLERFRAEPSPGSGVGALCPAGQPGPLFLVKPGSYPWPDAVWPAS